MSSLHGKSKSNNASVTTYELVNDARHGNIETDTEIKLGDLAGNHTKMEMNWKQINPVKYHPIMQ